MAATSNILILQWGRFGAGPKFAYEIAKALQQRDDVNVFLSVSKQAKLFADMQKLNLPGFYINTFSSLWHCLLATAKIINLKRRFKKFLQQHRIDYVLCPMHHVWNGLVLTQSITAKTPYLLFMHDASLHLGEQGFLRYWLYRQDLQKASRLVTLTEYVKQQYRQINKNIGIDVLPHPPLLNRDAIRPRSLEKTKKIKLLFFGRILAYKGLGLLLDAFVLLEKELKNLELHIIGSGNLTLYQDQLKCCKNVIVNNTWIAEAEIESHLTDKDILVLPYIEASQSGVINLVAALGIPVVATNVGGLSEQITNDVNGLLVPTISAPSIAVAIKRLLTEDRLYQQCSQGMLDSYNKGMCWGEVANHLIASLANMKINNINNREDLCVN